ncbi:MAG: hypothetical protein IAF38_02175 [Bacteroidia bacterium]|nr:hypothetical protein [Bacteroidia bacterium]
METHFAVSILNEGPNGSVYTDSAGKNFAFRSYRACIINDTIIPIELAINFAADSVALLPKSDRYLRVFLLPDTMTPDKLYDFEANNGFVSEGLKSFLNTGLTKATILKTTIKPKENYYVNIGTLFYPSGGLTGAGLFINGRGHTIPFVPTQATKTDAKNKTEQGLIFGIGIDPPHNYSLIPCGQIVFKK